MKEVFKKIKKSNHLDRLITLSPLTEMATKFHSNNRLTQNIFDFVCVCVPGFKELVLDGKNRPFERKVKQHTNLQRVEHNIFAKTGGFGYINNV